MPIYEYACRTCGSDFEKLVRSASASDDISCPECASPDVKKKLSTFAAKAAGGSASSTSAASCAPGGL